MQKDKLKAYVMLRQELIDEKKALEDRLNEINLVLEGTSFTPAKGRGRRGRPPGKAKIGLEPKAPRGKREGKLTQWLFF